MEIYHDEYGKYVILCIKGITQCMRWIEPGSFLMGSPDNEPGRWDDEGPQHEVRLSTGFWLFDTPVTQALWTAVIGDNPSYFKDPKHPVATVSWDDAMCFIEKINADIPGLDLVLPTEAQWEYACRAGTTTPNYAGSEEDLEDIVWFGKNSDSKTHPVGMKLRNQWGLYDMLGNVWEWCADDLREYSAEAVTDPVGHLDSTKRVLRGGAWGHNARFVRSAYRHAFDRNIWYYDIGFRCARVR